MMQVVRQLPLARINLQVIGAASILAVATSLCASPLLPGAVVFPVPDGPLPIGTVIADETVSFTSSTFTGTLTSEVVAGDATNPLGGLTFRYSLQDSISSPGEIERLTISSFAGVRTDVHFVAVPVTPNIQAPTLVDRSTGAGSTLGFAFIQPPAGFGVLQPGQMSVPLIVYTNSHVFVAANASVSDGSAVMVSSYATPALSGDVNLDGVVNAQDLALVSSNWLATGSNIAGDANADEIVNSQDLAVISSNWLAHIGSSTTAQVPEPMSSALLAIGALSSLLQPRIVSKLFPSTHARAARLRAA